MGKNTRNILLTFEVEEFDVPLEKGLRLLVAEQMSIGKQGLEAISGILEDKETPCTLFTTANFALKYPADIAALSRDHEIASHNFFHSSFKKEDLKNSRQVLEAIISKKVNGLRMPGMEKVEAGCIRGAGYTYDSSVNPTWLPGIYNNIRTPRTCYNENGIVRVPVSVSANFRIPLFSLAFRNLPYTYFKSLALHALKKDGCLSLYFHPWDFVDLDQFDLPASARGKSGPDLLKKLHRLVADLKNEGDFSTIQSYLENNNYYSYRDPVFFRSPQLHH
jgi:Domain of unknown function (DUF3473)/Polysaccharide deacetylase